MRSAIVGAVRTPIGRFGGSLSGLSAVDLGCYAVQGLLERVGVEPREIDELIFGQARQAGSGPNPARQVAIRSGIPQESPAWTVNQACASGLKSLLLARESLREGAGFVVAGGMESMSGVPFMLPRFRAGYGFGDAQLVDGMYRDGFWCPLADQVMGGTAETLAEKYGLSRGEQDAYALASQQRAGACQAAGGFDAERVPITLPDGSVFCSDEHMRPTTTLEKLARLPAVFGNTVSAGNSSGITDGAAALLLCSEQTASTRGLEVLAWLEDGCVVGVDPAIMGIGPVPAVRKLLQRLGRDLAAYDLVELNEAFAAQVLACERELQIGHERLNVDGGSIALGHPIGCTGARIAVTLIHGLRRRGLLHGMATACVSGGLGIAASFSRS